MTEHPIRAGKKYGMLMTVDNAQKAHDGDKTVTRRLIKSQPPSGISGVTETVVDGKRCWCFERKLPNSEWEFWHSKPRFWRHDIVAIKETHWRYGYNYTNYKGNRSFAKVKPFSGSEVVFEQPGHHLVGQHDYHKRQNLFLPFDLARTHWEITGVRPERLQDITTDDIRAEGITPRFEVCGADSAQDLFWKWEELWDSINPDHSWESNPWVWRYAGKKVTP